MTTYSILLELADAAVGNDKTLINTTAVGLKVEIIKVSTTTTSSVGSRSIDVVIQDDAAVELARITLTPTIPADQTDVTEYVYPGSADGELPPFVLRPNFRVQVVDTANIDVLDTVAVRMFVEGTNRVAAAA